MRKLRTSVVGVLRYSRQTCSIGRSESGSGFGGAFAARVAAAAEAVERLIARGNAADAGACVAAADDFAVDFGLAPAVGAVTPEARERLVTEPVPALGASGVVVRAAARRVVLPPFAACALVPACVLLAAARTSAVFDLLADGEVTVECSRAVLDIRSAP